MKKTAGFTLVELIVVIAILGILAGIAIPVYSGYISKAQEASDMQLLDSVKTAAVFAAVDANPEAVVTGITFTFGGSTVTYEGTKVPTEATDISGYIGENTASKGGNASATWSATTSRWELTKAAG